MARPTGISAPAIASSKRGISRQAHSPHHRHTPATSKSDDPFDPSTCRTSASASATFRIPGVGGLSVAAGRGEQPRVRHTTAWLRRSATGIATAGARLPLSCLQRSLTGLALGGSGPHVERLLASYALPAHLRSPPRDGRRPALELCASPRFVGGVRHRAPCFCEHALLQAAAHDDGRADDDAGCAPGEIQGSSSRPVTSASSLRWAQTREEARPPCCRGKQVRALMRLSRRRSSTTRVARLPKSGCVASTSCETRIGARAGTGADGAS